MIKPTGTAPGSHLIPAEKPQPAKPSAESAQSRYDRIAFQSKQDPDKYKQDFEKAMGMLQQANDDRSSKEKLFTQVRIGSIYNQLKTGLDISDADLAYLREKSPALYGKAERTMRERKAYRQALQRSKTKAEAQQAHNSKVAVFAGELTKTGTAGGVDLLETLEMSTAAIADEYGKFVATAQYRRLPKDDDEASQQHKAPKSKANKRTLTARV